MQHKLIRIASSLLIFAGVMLLVTHTAHAQFFDAPSDIERLRLSIFRGNLWDALGLLFSFFLLIAGLIAFLYVLWGGFLYLTAGGDAARAAQGRTFIVNALIGILIIFLSYSLVRFVISRTRTNNDVNFGHFSAP